MASRSSSVASSAGVLAKDAKALADDARHVLTSLGDQAGDKIVDMRKQVRRTAKRTRQGYRKLQSAAVGRFDEGTDLMRESPWTSVGIAFAIGALAILLLRPRR